MFNDTPAQKQICYWEGRKEIFYLTTHLTHFIYGYMASDIWNNLLSTEGTSYVKFHIQTCVFLYVCNNHLLIRVDLL